MESSGSIAAGVPLIEVKIPFRGRKWVCLPFTDHCPPLARSQMDLQKFVAELRSTGSAEGVSRVEIRSDLGGEGAGPAPAVIHRLRLDPDPEAVFARFKRSQVQRNIRRAQKEGVRVERSDSRHDTVDIFYSLHERTRHRQGVPVQPRRYFELLWEHMVRPGLGHVSVAYSSNKAIAAAVFLRWNGTVIYKYGASDAESWSLRPNHLIFWDAIEASCKEGDRDFDFGRTELSNTGLRNFKSGWGAEEEPLRYSALGDGAAAAPTGVSLAALVQPVLRRAPLWSCRALGALFYRYAA